MSGMLYLWPALPCKAILYPGTAVELAEFHSYDLSLTDAKECKIRKLSNIALPKKDVRGISKFWRLYLFW
jgi:hypothetical protein